MADPIEPLVAGGVINDGQDKFIKRPILSVAFGSTHVTSGCVIKPSICISPPEVAISEHFGGPYTLVMTDPDAPSPRAYWIVVDIPGGTNLNRGIEILPYEGPQSSVGVHCYSLVMFSQNGPSELVDQPPSRANFNSHVFARNHNLGLPVATVYFNVRARKKLNFKRLLRAAAIFVIHATLPLILHALDQM